MKRKSNKQIDKTDTMTFDELVDINISELDNAFVPLSVSLLSLLTSLSIMQITIMEQAPKLTKTPEWQRLDDAKRRAEKRLEETINRAKEALANQKKNSKKMLKTQSK